MTRWYRPHAGPVLIVAPHPDDEVVGCGGLMRTCAFTRVDVHVAYLTSCGEQRRREAHMFGCNEGSVAPGAALVRAFEELLSRVDPARLFVPSIADVHPDHRGALLTVACALENGAGRPGAVLEYEGLCPHRDANVFLDITSVAQDKFAALAEFRSQDALYRITDLVRHLNAYRARTTLRRRAEYAEAYAVSSAAGFVERVRMERAS
jgi:LmbE family N-acetylglucosaminyl deacetylase